MISKDNPTRDRLVREGLKALVLHGFDGIGLNAILQAARVPKGSFYYFFKSKEDFARAVMDAYERGEEERLNGILMDPTRSPVQRLREYFAAIWDDHLAQAPIGGCLFGVLSQTAAARSPEFRARLAEVFAKWEVEVAGVLEEAKAAGEVDPGLDSSEAAAFLIDCLEGALIRLKVDDNRDCIKRFERLAFRSLGIEA